MVPGHEHSCSHADSNSSQIWEPLCENINIAGEDELETSFGGKVKTGIKDFSVCGEEFRHYLPNQVKQKQVLCRIMMWSNEYFQKKIENGMRLGEYVYI